MCLVVFLGFLFFIRCFRGPAIDWWMQLVGKILPVGKINGGGSYARVLNTRIEIDIFLLD